MKIYEVIFTEDREDYKDTIFLVRASDYISAVELVQANAFGSYAIKKMKRPQARLVHEVGTDLSAHPDIAPLILRGPFYQSAYNYGWKAFNRKIVGSDYVDEWEEKPYG